MTTEQDAAAAHQSALDAAASATQAVAAKQAAESALAAVVGGSLPNAGSLQETDDVGVRRGGFNLKTTLTAIAQWVLQTYQGFMQTGTGAYARTYQERGQDFINALDFIPQAQRAAIIAGTSTYDAAADLQKAADEAKASKRRLTAYGKFRLGSTVNFREVALDMERARFEVNHAGIGVLVGGHASNSNNVSQVIGEVLRIAGADSITTPTVRCIGAKGQHITVHRTTYFQVYADTTPAVNSTDYSSAYSTFDLKYVNTVELTNNPANPGAIQWINECEFFLNRCFSILINGTYKHNHNKFYNGTLEGTATINVDSGVDNWFYGMRFEGGPTSIIFGANSERNVVEGTWLSSGTPKTFNTFMNSTVTDNGKYNLVYNRLTELQHRTLIARAAISEPAYNNRVGLESARLPQLQRITATSGTQTLLVSAMQPVKSGDVYEFKALAGDAGDPTLRYRPALAFFDKNFKPVADATGFVQTGALTTVAANVVTSGTGTALAEAGILAAAEAGAAFVRAEWRSSNSQTADAKARILEITRASRYDAVAGINLNPATPGLPAVSAVPTQSFVAQGFQVVKQDGTAIYICSFSLDTALSGAVAGAATSIVVASATGVTVGDIIGVNLDNRDTHWTTVSSVAGTTIGLTVAMPSAAADASRVVFNRWATK